MDDALEPPPFRLPAEVTRRWQEQELMEAYFREGMDIANQLAFPVRAANLVAGFVFRLLLWPNPRAQEAAKEVSKAIQQAWDGSRLGADWKRQKRDLDDMLQRHTSIPREDRRAFFQNLEELALAGAGSVSGTALQAIWTHSKRIMVRVAAKEEKGAWNAKAVFQRTGIEYFWSQPIRRPFAVDMPAEGMLVYRWIRGTDGSILIWTQSVRRNKEIQPFLLREKHATSKAYLRELKNIGDELGATRVYKSGWLVNKRLESYWHEHARFHGDHYVAGMNIFCPGSRHTYPVFELLPCISSYSPVTNGLLPASAWQACRQDSVPGSVRHPTAWQISYEDIADTQLDKSKMASGPVDSDSSSARPPPSDSQEDTFPIAEQNVVGPCRVVAEGDPDFMSVDPCPKIVGLVKDMVGEVMGLSAAAQEVIHIKGMLDRIMETPSAAPLEIAQKLLQYPTECWQNVTQIKEQLTTALLRRIDNSMTETILGCAAAVGVVLNFINSVSWICEFARNPLKGAKDLMKMPYTIVKNAVSLCRNLIRDPVHAGKQFFQSILTYPAQTVKRFLCAVGLRRKKKRVQPPEPAPVLTAAQWQQLVEQYTRDLQALYFLVRAKGFVDPFLELEEYHLLLQADFGAFQASAPGGIGPGSFFQFPAYLAGLLHHNSLLVLRCYSPRAHPDRPLFLPELLQEVEEVRELTKEVTKSLDALEFPEPPCAEEKENPLALPLAPAEARVEIYAETLQQQVALFHRTVETSKTLLQDTKSLTQEVAQTIVTLRGQQCTNRKELHELQARMNRLQLSLNARRTTF